MIPEKLRRWSEQPGAHITPTMRAFCFNLAAFLEGGGVGYGFAQQIVEWLWQERCERDGLPGGAWGPESHARERAELATEVARLRAALELVGRQVGSGASIRSLGLGECPPTVNEFVDAVLLPGGSRIPEFREAVAKWEATVREGRK